MRALFIQKELKNVITIFLNSFVLFNCYNKYYMDYQKDYQGTFQFTLITVEFYHYDTIVTDFIGIVSIYYFKIYFCVNQFLFPQLKFSHIKNFNVFTLPLPPPPPTQTSIDSKLHCLIILFIFYSIFINSKRE